MKKVELSDMLNEILKRRSDIINRVVAALAHLPIDQQINILGSHIPIDELEIIAVMLERK